MKIIAINGGPRMNQNTKTLLDKVIEGAKSKGASVEVFNLYQLDYKGCIACFSCKRKNNENKFHCAIKDDLTNILEKIEESDAIIFASPIYFYDVTGKMRSFLERLLFQYLPYDTRVEERTYFKKKLKTAFIYTLGSKMGPKTDRLKTNENFISQIFRYPVKTLYSCETYPFVDNYSNYEVDPIYFEPKLKQKEEEFPKECEKAFQFGVDFVTKE